MKKISIIIPCYNEALGISKVIRDIPKKLLRRFGFEVEVIVINNNSTDLTEEIISNYRVKRISEPRMGKGYAMRAGFDAVSADSNYVVMMDGDHTYKPKELFRLVEPLVNNFCDCVVGSRLGGKMKKGAFKLKNRVANWFFTFLVRSLYVENVTDVLSGYFAWKKECIDELKKHLTSTGFAIEMEMITKMHRLGYQVYSVPITYDRRNGTSKLNPWKDGVRIITMLFKNLTWKPDREASRQKSEIGIQYGEQNSNGKQLKSDFRTPNSDNRSKRIAFVSDAIYPYNKGGKEKRLYEISTRLAKESYDVHIYTMHWWKEKSNQKSEFGIQLHAISKYYPLYSGERRSIKQGIMFALACLKLLREDFDVIDVDHMPYFPLFTMKLVCLLKRKKMFATWNEVWGRKYWMQYMGISGNFAYFIEKLSMHLPDSIISISDLTTSRLRKELGDKKIVTTVGIGIDLENIQKIDPAQEKSDVIFVGRLLKHKNVDLLLAAVNKLKIQNPNVKCIVVGDGPEKKNLENLVYDLGLQNNVVFKGIVEDYSQVYALMKSSKVFVLPSSREGFGIVVLEANACGIPVVTSVDENNAAKDMISPNNGIITNLNSQDLAIAIQRSTTFIKENFYSHVSRFNWVSIIKNMVRTYML